MRVEHVLECWEYFCWYRVGSCVVDLGGIFEFDFVKVGVWGDFRY